GHADKIAEMAQFHVPTSIPRGLLRAIPKAIVSFSPALLDEIGLRWVPNHELRSTLKGLNSCARNGEATQTEFRYDSARARLCPEDQTQRVDSGSWLEDLRRLA